MMPIKVNRSKDSHFMSMRPVSEWPNTIQEGYCSNQTIAVTKQIVCGNLLAFHNSGDIVYMYQTKSKSKGK
jgi:hypothetical protein